MRFPFSQNFRKFRFGSWFGSKWNMFRRSSTGKFSGKVEILKRYTRFPGWNVLNRISCSIYTFLVLYIGSNCYELGSHLGVPSGNRLGAVAGFTIKWNNFLPSENPFFSPPKFNIPDFLSKWKAPKDL